MFRQFGPTTYPDHVGAALLVISLIGAIGFLMLMTLIK